MKINITYTDDEQDRAKEVISALIAIVPFRVREVVKGEKYNHSYLKTDQRKE